MKERQAQIAFAALSQETRLRIVRELVVAGPQGLAAGAIAEAVGVSASNVSFHLKELEAAELVRARRDGRSMFYASDHGTLADLIRFLLDDCCSGRLVVSRPSAATEESPT
jgi:ArsR family transcriptional regulator